MKEKTYNICTIDYTHCLEIYGKPEMLVALEMVQRWQEREPGLSWITVMEAVNNAVTRAIGQEAKP